MVWSELGRNGKLTLCGTLGKCTEFQEKKKFFSKFQYFLLFWEWFKCYFWIPHPKIHKGTTFHENWVNQTQKYGPKCTTKNFQDGRQEDEKERLWSKLLIATPQKLFEIEPWNLVLLLISWHVHMLQISLKFEKVGFRHVPLWCGISRKPSSRNYSKQFFSVC